MTKLKPVTPGELLLEEFLRPMGNSQYRLAKEIGVPAQRIGEIVMLLVKKVKITQPVTMLDFVVPKEPKKARIDPPTSSFIERRRTTSLK